MKKKILLSLTAIAIVFTSLFSFTACNKSKVKITKNMKPEKAYEAIVKSDVKSYTIEMKSEGYTQYYRTTTEGFSLTHVEGDKTSFSAYIYDGKRFYTMNKDGDDVSIDIMDMLGAKSSEATQYRYYLMNYYVLDTLEGYIYNEKNGYKNDYSVKVEKGKLIIIANDEDVRVTLSKINETTLEVPQELSDYATRATTSYAASFEEIDGKFAFTELNFYLTKFSIPETFNGETVTAIIGKDSSNKCNKLTIPASVTYIENLQKVVYSSSDIYYSGTKAQWGAVEIKKDGLSQTFTVHCTDGDVEITKD